MANAVRCPSPLHSLPQNEITRIGAEQTATDAGQPTPLGATGAS